MDINRHELVAVNEADSRLEAGLVELTELQLVAVGGGCGEVVFG